MKKSIMETLTKTKSKTSIKTSTKIGIAFFAGLMIAAAGFASFNTEDTKQLDTEKLVLIRNPENVVLQTSKGEITVLSATSPDGTDCLVDMNSLITQIEEAPEPLLKGSNHIRLDYKKIILDSGEEIYICSGKGSRCEVVVKPTGAQM